MMYWNKNYGYFIFLYWIIFLSYQSKLITGKISQNDTSNFFSDVDFARPQFDQTVYTVFDLLISTPNGTTIFTFNVQPSFVSTSSTNRTLNHTSDVMTVASNDSSFTAITLPNDSYALVINTFPLNYFRPYHRYLLNLTATQKYSNGSKRSSTALVQINLENYNVHAPIFSSPNQTFSISETAPIGSPFGTVHVTDADDDGIIYSIDSSPFSIDPNTGVLQLEQTLQSTATLQYSVIVIVSDDGSSCLPTRPPCPMFSISTTITINVMAVNRRSPQFLDGICGSTISLNENNAIGTNIISITVSDGDRGENGQVTISFPSKQSGITEDGLRNPAYSHFYLEQESQIDTIRTAHLRTNISFDYDAPGATRVWNLVLLAMDHGTPQQNSALCTFQINLVDSNDNPPVFLMTSWNYTIYHTAFENTINRRLLRIFAMDADLGLNGLVYYYSERINVTYFIIDEYTGTITLRSDVSITDLQVNQFPMTLQVYAQDFGSPSRISEVNATVTIYYNDDNQTAPARWLDPAYEDINLRIIEKYYETYGNQPIFNSKDGFNGTILYTLTSQTSSVMTVRSPFSSAYIPFRGAPVSSNGDVFSSGILVTSGLHAHIQHLYSIYLHVPTNPPLTGLATVILIDQNDQIPTFNIRSLTVHIIENEGGTRMIAQMQAFDYDIEFPNNYVRYYFNTNRTDAESLTKFSVASDGTVWTDVVFDYENDRTSYQLFITAYDGAPAWNSSTNQPNKQDFQLDVHIIDLNDAEPVFLQPSSVRLSINETIINRTVILNLTVVDADIKTNLTSGILSGNTKNVFAFYLTSDNSANVSRTEYQAIGRLDVVGSLDYELIQNYTLVLFAFDTENLVTTTVTIELIPQNTKAPSFQLIPGSTVYHYQVTEGTAAFLRNGPAIRAIDLDIPATVLLYTIVTYNTQWNLSSLYLDQSNDQVILGVAPPGLSSGYSDYHFAIRVTDDGGAGVSSYIPVTIEVIEKNDYAPIPTNSPWILMENITNPSTSIVFTDYDDPKQKTSIPFRIEIISPSNFSLSISTRHVNETYNLTYHGILNRTVTKNLTVTFNTSDSQGHSAITTIPIIIGDMLNTYPISDGHKTINITYIRGYMNSLGNIPLGSIYANDLDDWFRADRTYSIRNVSNKQTFSTSQGLLSTSNGLYPGSYIIHVDVIKPNALSSALSTINLEVKSIDSEYVREAATIRIQGEYPETLVDPSLGNRLNTLRNALALILLVPADSIIILAIQPVYQYRDPFYPPLPFDQAKQQALTDVIFYVATLKRDYIEDRLNSFLPLFPSRFGIIVNASGPSPCSKYTCPTGTVCRPTRTIEPPSSTIDSNQTSFVGINILDSADCVNVTNFTNTQSGCTTYSFNNLTYCPCTSLQAYAPLGPYCQVLGRTFNEGGGAYAVFDGKSFSNRAPTRFSLDFVIRSPVRDGVISLYGRNSTPINRFFWTAIEIYQSRLRFHFRQTIVDASNTTLNTSTWYHVEYQYIGSRVLVSINDDQYVKTVNDTLNRTDLSNVQLYLGGLPTTISGLYPSLTQVNKFNGCIRNVLSNGYYLDMSQPIISANSNSGQCPCAVTDSCLASSTAPGRVVFIWMMIALLSINISLRNLYKIN